MGITVVAGHATADGEELRVRHSRVTLLKAVGLDFRRVGQDWALNQLLHNYTEECFLHLFATWAFTLGRHCACKYPRQAYT